VTWWYVSVNMCAARYNQQQQINRAQQESDALSVSEVRRQLAMMGFQNVPDGVAERFVAQVREQRLRYTQQNPTAKLNPSASKAASEALSRIEARSQRRTKPMKQQRQRRRSNRVEDDPPSHKNRCASPALSISSSSAASSVLETSEEENDNEVGKQSPVSAAVHPSLLSDSESDNSHNTSSVCKESHAPLPASENLVGTTTVDDQGIEHHADDQVFAPPRSPPLVNRSSSPSHLATSVPTSHVSSASQKHGQSRLHSRPSHAPIPLISDDDDDDNDDDNADMHYQRHKPHPTIRKSDSEVKRRYTHMAKPRKGQRAASHRRPRAASSIGFRQRRRNKRTPRSRRYAALVSSSSSSSSFDSQDSFSSPRARSAADPHSFVPMYEKYDHLRRPRRRRISAFSVAPSTDSRPPWRPAGANIVKAPASPPSASSASLEYDSETDAIAARLEVSRRRMQAALGVASPNTSASAATTRTRSRHASPPAHPATHTKDDSVVIDVDVDSVPQSADADFLSAFAHQDYSYDDDDNDSVSDSDSDADAGVVEIMNDPAIAHRRANREERHCRRKTHAPYVPAKYRNHEPAWRPWSRPARRSRTRNADPVSRFQYYQKSWNKSVSRLATRR
jgi:hypothetical protein